MDEAARSHQQTVELMSEKQRQADEQCSTLSKRLDAADAEVRVMLLREGWMAFGLRAHKVANRKFRIDSNDRDPLAQPSQDFR